MEIGDACVSRLCGRREDRVTSVHELLSRRVDMEIQAECVTQLRVSLFLHFGKSTRSQNAGPCEADEAEPLEKSPLATSCAVGIC